MRLVECAVIGDANLGIRSTPLAASSDSQMVKIFAFYSRAATVASTLQPNIVTGIIPMQKPTKPTISPLKHSDRSSRVTPEKSIVRLAK